MSLHTPKLSDSSLRTIQQGVDHLAQRSGYEDRLLAEADTTQLTVAVPHDVYSLGLDAIAQGKGLSDAERVGRRVLVMEGDRPILAAELQDPDGEGGFTATEGPYTETTAQAVSDIETWPTVANGEYELRMLRLPALYLMALWLKDYEGQSDLIVPIAPTPSGLEPGVPYTEHELFAALRERTPGNLTPSENEEA
jgi:hypothetical protein